jgi:xanthine dehydrogenase YagR molybdenum-binding subunit
MLASPEGKLRALTIDTYGDGGVSVGNTAAGLAGFMYGTHHGGFVTTTWSPMLLPAPFRGPGGPPLA